MNPIITCRNIGCRESFKTYIQRLRHEAKCLKPAPVDTSIFEELPDVGSVIL